MHPEKIKSCVALYRQELRVANVKPTAYRDDFLYQGIDYALGNCYELLDQIEDLIQKGRIDDTLITFGQVQGILHSNGIYTCRDLKEHRNA